MLTLKAHNPNISQRTKILNEVRVMLYSDVLVASGILERLTAYVRQQAPQEKHENFPHIVDLMA